MQTEPLESIKTNLQIMSFLGVKEREDTAIMNEDMKRKQGSQNG